MADLTEIYKYNIFLKSNIILHPAIYDSEGMAACEGMAWGLPAVGFDLESLKTYYSKGMLKVSVGNYKDFSKKVIELLENKELYEKAKNEAIIFASKWDWSHRQNIIFSKLNNLI